MLCVVTTILMTPRWRLLFDTCAARRRSQKLLFKHETPIDTKTFSVADDDYQCDECKRLRRRGSGRLPAVF